MLAEVAAHLIRSCSADSNGQAGAFSQARGKVEWAGRGQSAESRRVQVGNHVRARFEASDTVIVKHSFTNAMAYVAVGVILVIFIARC